jgi:DNA-binding response OmpR family regulator
MENNISILIYEKDKILKSIITKQLSYVKEYKLYLIEKNEDLLNALTNNHFDAFILNLNDLERDIPTFFDIIHNNKKHKNIIIYYDNHLTKVTDIDKSVIYLKMPFKISSLLKYLKDYENNNKENNSEIYLMDKLVFLPFQKIVMNKMTNKNQHLTEKETNLLKYLYNNKNSLVLKKNLLNSVWKINENVNTHTLETHLYRLKQKLYNLEPKLTFSLVNQNGKYIYKNNI